MWFIPLRLKRLMLHSIATVQISHKKIERGISYKSSRCLLSNNLIRQNVPSLYLHITLYINNNLLYLLIYFPMTVNSFFFKLPPLPCKRDI
jgi:hypothetical protein